MGYKFYHELVMWNKVPPQKFMKFGVGYMPQLNSLIKMADLNLDQLWNLNIAQMSWIFYMLLMLAIKSFVKKGKYFGVA